MRIKLNAFDKTSSASYSKMVDAENYNEFLTLCAGFDTEVPFHRFYTDHENETEFSVVNQWIRDEDNGVTAEDAAKKSSENLTGRA